MKTHCPTCGQLLIRPDLIDHLTPTQRRIIELLQRRKNMSGEDLRNAIWPQANGGPDSASLLHVHIWHLNKRLRAHGLAVRASRWSGYRIKNLKET